MAKCLIFCLASKGGGLRHCVCCMATTNWQVHAGEFGTVELCEEEEKVDSPEHIVSVLNGVSL